MSSKSDVAAGGTGSRGGVGGGGVRDRGDDEMQTHIRDAYLLGEEATRSSERWPVGQNSVWPD